MSTSVLVVDADLQVTKLVTGILVSRGYEVRTANEAESAMASIGITLPPRAHRPRHAGCERPRVPPPRPRGIEGAHHRHVWRAEALSERFGATTTWRVS